MVGGPNLQRSSEGRNRWAFSNGLHLCPAAAACDVTVAAPGTCQSRIRDRGWARGVISEGQLAPDGDSAREELVP